MYILLKVRIELNRYIEKVQGQVFTTDDNNYNH